MLSRFIQATVVSFVLELITTVESVREMTLYKKIRTCRLSTDLPHKASSYQFARDAHGIVTLPHSHSRPSRPISRKQVFSVGIGNTFTPLQVYFPTGPIGGRAAVRCDGYVNVCQTGLLYRKPADPRPKVVVVIFSLYTLSLRLEPNKHQSPAYGRLTSCPGRPLFMVHC